MSLWNWRSAIGGPERNIVQTPIDTLKGPFCGTCGKTVEKAVVTVGAGVARLTVECHDVSTCYSIPPAIAMNQDSLYEYLEKFRKRTMFEKPDASNDIVQVRLRDGSITSMTREQQRSLRYPSSVLDPDEFRGLQYKTSNTTDVPRSFQVAPQWVTLVASSAYPFQFNSISAEPAQEIAKATAKTEVVRPIVIDTKKRAIRLDD